MSNAKDISTEVNPSILLMGDGGTHKTHFACGIPGVYIFDFDGGMAIAKGKDVQYDTFKDAPGVKASGATLKPLKGNQSFHEHGKAWPAFIQKLNVIGERIDKGERVPLCLDSLTTMANVCMNYVLKESGHTGAPQIQHWGAQIQLLETVMDQLTAWPVPIVVTAHLQRNTNDISQVVEQLPLVTGKFAGKIGIYFDEVYLTKVKIVEGKAVFTLQTTSDSMVKQVKSRHGVKDGTKTDWNEVLKAFAVPFVS